MKNDIQGSDRPFGTERRREGLHHTKTGIIGTGPKNYKNDVFSISSFCAIWCKTLLIVFLAGTAEAAERAEVVVYGGTPAGVMAAVAAAKHGHTVALVDINAHVGGVVSGGLVATDMGDPKTVGGLAGEFFQRVTKYYKEKYGPESKQSLACNEGRRLEPSVAEKIYDEMIAEQPGIKVYRHLRFQSLTQAEGKITSITVSDPAENKAQTFEGDVFIDASYEGDVMAAAHVPYRVGREGRTEYGEYLAGVGMGPKSVRGMSDHRTMAYNYRVSITSNTENRILCPKPEHYDPTPFMKAEGVGINARGTTDFLEMYSGREKSAGPNDKYDSNWADFVGNSEGYAEGDWATRDRIAARQRDYVLSRLYYLQNGPDLPAEFRASAQKWGLPKDEFADNGNFPFQLYIREARRMIGRYVLKEQDLTQDRWKADGIATGGYGVDCHVVQHLMVDGKETVEHTRHVACNNYDIPYASLTPIEPGNLLVPVCCSASHVAYCSLRMEPVCMMLGHASGDAAHLALNGKTTVQKVNPTALRQLLLEEHSVLDAGYQPQVRILVVPAHPKIGDRVVIKAVEGKLLDPIVSYAWDFEGVGKKEADIARAVHVFNSEKVYTVSLLVTDKVGRKRLLTTEIPVGAADARDVTMDDFEADEFGRWDGAYPDNVTGPPLLFSDVFLGPGIHRDVVRNGKKAPARLRFQPTIPRTGRYQLCLGFLPSKTNATNVPVLVKHAGGNTKLKVDERKSGTEFIFSPIGEFTFKAGDTGFVEITNGNTDGRVIVDGVRWVWLGE